MRTLRKNALQSGHNNFNDSDFFQIAADKKLEREVARQHLCLSKPHFNTGAMGMTRNCRFLSWLFA